MLHKFEKVRVRGTTTGVRSVAFTIDPSFIPNFRTWEDVLDLRARLFYNEHRTGGTNLTVEVHPVDKDQADYGNVYAVESRASDSIVREEKVESIPLDGFLHGGVSLLNDVELGSGSYPSGDFVKVLTTAPLGEGVLRMTDSAGVSSLWGKCSDFSSSATLEDKYTVIEESGNPILTMNYDPHYMPSASDADIDPKDIKARKVGYMLVDINPVRSLVGNLSTNVQNAYSYGGREMPALFCTELDMSDRSNSPFYGTYLEGIIRAYYIQTKGNVGSSELKNAFELNASKCQDCERQHGVWCDVQADIPLENIYFNPSAQSKEPRLLTKGNRCYEEPTLCPGEVNGCDNKIKRLK